MRWLGCGILVLSCCGMGTAGEELNLLANASFEVVHPEGWSTHTWGGEAAFNIASESHTGGRSVQISSTAGADAGWTIELPVQPHTAYRLTAWIKTRDVTTDSGQGALLNVHEMDARTAAVTGTKGWTQVSTDFDSAEREKAQINCLLGGWGLAKGTAWFDDVRLSPVAIENGRVEAQVDAAHPGAPISKYVYGQFIEHLGRCIYGGIWAEMLEDRKFFYAPGTEHSAWKILGEPAALSLNTTDPYVGKQSPRITPGNAEAGIVQAGIGLLAGRRCDGSILLRASEPDMSVSVRLRMVEDTASVEIANPGTGWTTHPLSFTPKSDADNAVLEIVVRGSGSVDIGTLSLMPADNIHGMRADTLALLQELDAPVYRWPGGNFVSGYDWRVALGDRDKRPPMKNPAWEGIEHHDFGIDEYMVFCREVNTEPLVVVNSGLGDLQMAVEELQYCNAGTDTPMGARRAANGHPDPYQVRWWGVGNEMYGDWQLGHVPLADYVKKHNEYAQALRAVDPAIQLIGVGATGPWSETMLSQCADNMNLLSEHFYCGERAGIFAHVRQIPDNIRAKVAAHRAYHETIPQLKDKRIPISMDEWNYWYGPHQYGELGVRYFLKDALGIAAGLHEYFRNSAWIEMANYAQTVNVIGCIKTTSTHAAFETTGLALKLYRQRFGELPLPVAGVPAPLDVAAAWTADRRAVTVGIVNPLDREMSVHLEVAGAVLEGGGEAWIITAPDPLAFNTPGETPQVEIRPQPVASSPGELVSPPLSITLYRLPAAAPVG